jgi:hypothetical protein
MDYGSCQPEDPRDRLLRIEFNNDILRLNGMTYSAGAKSPKLAARGAD